MGGDRYAVADKNLDQSGLYILFLELLKLPFPGISNAIFHRLPPYRKRP